MQGVKGVEPYQLMDAWREAGEELVIFSSAVFEGLPVPSEAKAFLGEVGLPASAAPFLISPRQRPECSLLSLKSGDWMTPVSAAITSLAQMARGIRSPLAQRVRSAT